MKWKNRLTNYNFWVSIISAILLILQNFNIEFDLANFGEITTAVLGLLVVIGIINDPTKSATKNKDKEDKLESLENKQENTNQQTKIEEAPVCEVANEKLEQVVEEKEHIAESEESAPMPNFVKNESSANTVPPVEEVFVEEIEQNSQQKILPEQQKQTDAEQSTTQNQQTTPDATKPLPTVFNIVG